MDRMTNARQEAAEPKQEMKQQPTLEDPSEDWMRETRLCDLKADEPLVMVRERTTIHTTPRELIRVARMPATMTMEQVRAAFSTPDKPSDNVVPIWRQRLPRGR